ncbi:MAG: hypothetical protein QM233_00490 [Candidatus Cloacimonadota bacterium]|jgi:hypothetical protein|nr:hypothetical protein [Candidatus Cloacimonadota bacterium]NMD11919.1 hypothetical protein [Candidatus Cloacimonadota bacterium]
MKRYYLFCLLVLISLLLAMGGCVRGRSANAGVEVFEALDMPHDDGSGVLLRWKPLDKSHRIIQYNVYRGHSPDSLFLLGNIEVDPKQGVMGEYLFFYDRDYLPLVQFETAPSKLKKEKHQAPDSPLYQAVPRDANVVSTMLPHYSVLGNLTARGFYNGSRRVEKDGEEGKEVFAGFKLNQFESIYANPLPGNTYYYSVVAVTETGRRTPAARVCSVIPVDNRPDSSAVFATTYIQDTRQFKFEWSPPTGTTDIGLWQGWLMPKSLLPLYRQEQQKNASAPDSVFYAAWQNGSIRLFEHTPPYWSQTFYHQVDAAAEGINLPSSLQDYIPVLSFMDYGGFQAATLGKSAQVKNSAELPIVPAFQVIDKVNDKGDNLIVSFGKPFAFITQASYTSSRKNKLRVNYELSKNEHYEIDRLRFTFQDTAKNTLGTVTEYYLDNVIKFKLPAGLAKNQSFRVRVEFRLRGEKDFDPQVVWQDVTYDAKAMRFNGSGVTLNGQLLNKYFFDVFAKSKLDSDYSPVMRIGGISRAFDHTIPFEDTVTPEIVGFDQKTGRLLLEPNFKVAKDPVSGAVLWAPLYKQDFAPYLTNLEKELAELKAGLAPDDSLSEAAQELRDKQAELDFARNHPAYAQAKDAKSDKAWRKVFRAEKDKNSRSYAYQLLMTDGKGFWNIAEPASGDGEEIWNYPVGNWFDNTKWATLIASFVMLALVVYTVSISRRKELYIRPIAGLAELDNAVGRATEMGRPVMFVPGWGTLGDVCTISAMMILNQIAKKTAEYDIRLISPHVDYFVVPLAQEMVQTAYSEMGRPDAYNQNDIFFVSDTQFAFCAAVNGITVRERVATIFYMGYFYAEALLMTETGNQSGAIQIAATDAITQIPFFITTCDYTLIGEEFYAASAYLSRDPSLVSMLKAQDYFKLIIVVCVIIGVVLSTAHVNAFLNFLPFE